MSINEESSSKEAPPSSAEASCPSSSFAALMSKAPYDYVLLTDCVFSAKLAIPLVNTIRCCCGPRTTVLCCHEIRDEVNCHIVQYGYSSMLPNICSLNFIYFHAALYM